METKTIIGYSVGCPCCGAPIAASESSGGPEFTIVHMTKEACEKEITDNGGFKGEDGTPAFPTQIRLTYEIIKK